MKVSLKAARINANLTQKEVGETLGISRETVRFIESGKREITYSEFKHLCNLYNCTEDDLILPYKSPLNEN